MKPHSLWLVAATISFCRLGYAEPTDASREAEGQRQARALFQAGLSHAQQGDLLTALAEFEDAYRAQPHFSVLYNIAQTRSALGHPVEANEAFKRYLIDGGNHVSTARREEVAGLISANQDRIGQIKLIVPPGESLHAWLDGAELEAEQLTQPIAVARGDHTLVYGTLTGPARSRKISVSGAQLTEIKLENAPLPTASSPLTQLAISCAVPDVRVSVDGVSRGTTPLKAPLLVAVGQHRVEFSRAGYSPSTREVHTKAGELLQTSCAQRPLPELPSVLATNLDVRAEPSQARVELDGEPFVGGSIPAGSHRLRVEADGFLPEDRAIVGRAGQRQALSITLAPTPATRAAQDRANSTHKLGGIVLGGFAVAAIGSSVGVYEWNSARYDRWGGAAHATPQQAASIQRGDDAALGLAISGAVLAAAAAWEFLAP